MEIGRKQRKDKESIDGRNGNHWGRRISWRHVIKLNENEEKRNDSEKEIKKR